MTLTDIGRRLSKVRSYSKDFRVTSGFDTCLLECPLGVVPPLLAMPFDPAEPDLGTQGPARGHYAFATPATGKDQVPSRFRRPGVDALVAAQRAAQRFPAQP